MATQHGAPSTTPRTKRKASDDIKALLESPVDLKKVSPYEPRKELAPKSAVLSKEWKVIEDGKLYIYRLITEPFTESQYSSKLKDKLVTLAEERLLKQKQNKIVVCTVGDMGCGKSATLNSLFQVGRIARSEAMGRSCTLASQKFRAPKPGQKEPFLAEVHFFTHEERHEILSSYLRDYFRAVFGTSESEEPATTPDEDEGAIVDEVISAMLSLFRGCNVTSAKKDGIQTKKDVRDFLEAAENEHDSKILCQMYQWCDNVIRHIVGEKLSFTVTASTAGELVAKLEPYSKAVDVDDGETGAAPYPLVSLIDFHFNDPLTQGGKIFLDTPGTSDRNRTRKMSAHKQSLKATHAMVVAAADRAQDNACIAIEVKKTQRRGPNRAAVIIPKSDDIGPGMPSGSKLQKDRAMELQNVHGKLERQLQELEDTIQQYQDEGDDEKVGPLCPEKTQLEAKVKRAENATRAQRIATRSVDTKKKLQEKLEQLPNAAASQPVPVYSVSNTVYAQHLAGYTPKKAPVMGVEETNIPNVRRLPFTFSNEARLNEARHSLDITTPSLLSRVHLFTSRPPTERKSEIERLVKAPLDAYEVKIGDVFEQFAKTIVDIAIHPMQNEESDFNRKALVLCNLWEEKNKTSQFTALMNRDGHRRNGKNGAINMSGGLILLKSARLTRLFGKTAPGSLNFEKQLEDDIWELYMVMLEAVKGDANSSYVDIEPFLRYIQDEAPRLKAAAKRAAAKLATGLDRICNKATFADEDAYIVEAMLPVYNAVRILKAPRRGDPPAANPIPKPREGWPQYRKNTFKHEVTQNHGIWMSMVDGIVKDIDILFKLVRGELVDEVGSIFEDFQAGFNDMCSANEDQDPEEQLLQAKLTENLEKAQEHLNGKMKGAFEVLMRDYSNVALPEAA